MTWNSSLSSSTQSSPPPGAQGHNGVLQTYLREQPDNIRSLDLVTETVRYLHMIAQDVTEENLDLVMQVRHVRGVLLLSATTPADLSFSRASPPAVVRG